MMPTHKELHDFLLTFESAVLEFPFGEGVAVYKVHGKMFALVSEKSDPIQLSLKCDPLLAQTLRETYETIMPGYHLNKKHWNTVIMSGQLRWAEVQPLIRHSYDIVTATK